jgi:hypothetical protein
LDLCEGFGYGGGFFGFGFVGARRAPSRKKSASSMIASIKINQYDYLS